MKCIDAIEGTVKYIFNRLHALSKEDRLDDTEYIRNVKAVIEATDKFLQDNPELVEGPELVKQVLYNYSRDLWLTGEPPAEQAPDKIEEAIDEKEEYQTYYYDYIYHRGVYPR